MSLTEERDIFSFTVVFSIFHSEFLLKTRVKSSSAKLEFQKHLCDLGLHV